MPNPIANIRDHKQWTGPEESSLPAGTGGGDNGGMDRISALETRVANIDDRLARIEADMSSLKDSFSGAQRDLASIDAKLDISSIRASVEKSHTDIYKWVVSIIAVVGAIYFGLQRIPQPLQQTPTSAQAPLIIQVPSPTQTPQSTTQ